ncbi:NAD(P)H-dependent oxidoreductase [Actinocorallia populi]|uniref:NAD(P)H-dependent oxidoreductase n=1 Tax=Actinocorallia populi TaxID=2079200 RepID=UPI000D089986|nr:NADPH-dependent FMN reductase [Actinocorallia populi]
MSVRVLALVGSLRAGSHNLQLAHLAARLSPEGTEISVYEGLGDLPFYNEDIDREGLLPDAAARLRRAAAEADTLVLFTPEYNGTMPAVLKNAIDWLSRPFGAGALTGKPVAVIGTAYGQYGGVWAHDEARKAVRIAGATPLEDITLSIPGSVERFADIHPGDDPEVVERLTDVITRLAEATAPQAA